MSDVVERLLWLRKKGDLVSKADAARAYGIPYEIYKKIEADERSLTTEHTTRIADFHRVSRGWLLFGEGTPEGEMSVPLAGMIGAGQQMMLFEDMAEAGQRVEALLVRPDAVAFEVRGDSMFPLARDRDYVFVGPPRRDFMHLIGSECAVLLEDGRRFFKVLERGSQPHLFDLHSYNADRMRDVEVHSAGPFLGVRRC